jgi:thiamine-phosphate pyrophosphorylase
MREIYRILDANFNRAREAMRVVEDYARFALDDPVLAGSAKDLRDALRTCCEKFPADELLAGRDTPGDVGVALTSAGEARREGPTAVVTAACKRLTESLRTLGEYAKVVEPGSAAALESMRYAAYTLEQRIARRIAGPQWFHEVRLYVLLTSGMCRGDPLATAEAAIAGGADCLQLREKTLPDRQVLALARKLRELTARTATRLIINDRPDIAAAVGADGVHLGQDDLPVSAARRVLAPSSLIGKSTHSLDQARAVVAEGADYIGVGPMFPTNTKKAGDMPGVALLAKVAAETSVPHVAIGGISAANVSLLVQAGARRVAVCSAIIASDDPAAAAAAIKAAFAPAPSA